MLYNYFLSLLGQAHLLSTHLRNKATRSLFSISWNQTFDSSILILNIDSASKENLGPTAIGGIIRHIDGSFIVGFSFSLAHVSTNIEVEIMI